MYHACCCFDVKFVWGLEVAASICIRREENSGLATAVTYCFFPSWQIHRSIPLPEPTAHGGSQMKGILPLAVLGRPLDLSRGSRSRSSTIWARKVALTVTLRRWGWKALLRGLMWRQERSFEIL